MEEKHNKIKIIKRRGFGYRISIVNAITFRNWPIIRYLLLK
ncbi:hypothetical protein I6E62_18710 [Niallia circulans]|nr:hypothetical protein [Niallia circulans]